MCTIQSISTENKGTLIMGFLNAYFGAEYGHITHQKCSVALRLHVCRRKLQHSASEKADPWYAKGEIHSKMYM